MPDYTAVTMRLANEDDVPAIRAVTRAAYVKWIPSIGREPLPMTVDYASVIRAHRFDLLELSGELVALIETVPHPDHLWIENLAVFPSRQGSGLGRRMLAHAQAVARSLGLPEIRLVTNRAFSSNIDFYLRAGFVIDREEPFRGGMSVYFRKML